MPPNVARKRQREAIILGHHLSTCGVTFAPRQASVRMPRQAF
jgi:hypothetical protein